MSKINNIKSRLLSDPDGMFTWFDGGHLPTGVHEKAEITGLQSNIMLDGYEDLYIITVLPGDEYGVYDAWLRRAGSTDMVRIAHRRARGPEDVMITAMQNMPDYMTLV